MLFNADQISMTLREWDNPVLFQHALKQLNIPADEAIAFGNEICDAQAASNAGIKAYHCLWGAKDVERDQILADPIIPASPPRSRSSTSWNKPPRRLSNNLSSHNPRCRA